jgi:hypothetical protein
MPSIERQFESGSWEPQAKEKTAKWNKIKSFLKEQGLNLAELAATLGTGAFLIAKGETALAIPAMAIVAAAFEMGKEMGEDIKGMKTSEEGLKIGWEARVKSFEKSGKI